LEVLMMGGDCEADVQPYHALASNYLPRVQ